ncbi:MAG: NADH-quinone oxidoreductase subunit J [Ktedonobacterales bacterium]
MLFAQISFWVLAVVVVASALGVILFRNAVYCMLSLILNLLCLAFFFLSLNALFVATIQVLIYAGAVMVLFLFVVTMLAPGERIGVGQSDPLRWQWGAGIGLGVILAGALTFAAFTGAIASDAQALGASQLSAQVTASGNTEAFGLALFHGYSFPFEVTGLLLVVAVLGAVALGRRPTRERE